MANIIAYDAPAILRNWGNSMYLAGYPVWVLGASDDFGAVFNAAIAAGYSDIVVSPGNFSYSTTSVLGHYTRFWGSGINSTIFTQANGANVDFLNSTNPGAYTANVMNIDVAYFTINGNKANNASGNGLWVQPWDSHIHDLYITSVPGIGIHKDGSAASTDDVWIERCTILSSGSYNIKVGSGYSSPKTFLLYNNLSLPDADGNLYANGDSNTVIGNVVYGDLPNNTSQIYMQGRDLIISHNHIEDIGNNSCHGLRIDNPPAVNIFGITVTNNHFLTKDATSQLYLYVPNGLTFTNSTISGNQFIVDTAGTVTHGIYMLSGGGTFDGILFSNNTFTSLGTFTNKVTSVAGSVFRNNAGYITENSGTATVVNTATSVVVNHGLATTPTRVQISLTNNPTNDPQVWWVDTLGTTQFTIHTKVDPGASGAIFNWRAVIGEGN